MSGNMILTLVAAIFGGAMAMVVPWQERRSLAHWAFAAGMGVLALESAFVCLSLSATGPEAVIHWQAYKFTTQAFLPGIWLFFSLSYARGNSSEFLNRWRFMLAAAFLLPLGIAFWFDKELFNPINSSDGKWLWGLSIPGVLLNVLFLLSIVLVMMNLERTFRASVGTMRWRIKFVLIGLVILFLVRAYTSTNTLLYRRVDPALEVVDSVALLVAGVLILRSLMRSGHFDVNVYPSHTVIHNSIIVLIVGVYLLTEGLFANIVRLTGANTSLTVKAFILLVGLVLLSMTLLSDRVRLHIKRFVSRNFQRPMYDYRTVWRRFTECTATRLDQRELCRETVKLVAEIFQVLSVTIWIVDEKKSNLVFGSSTSLLDGRGLELAPKSSEAVEVIRALQYRAEPVDIDATSEEWAMVLRRIHPEEFRHAGRRICVPMIVGGEVLGLMTLGDRVGGIDFMHQDLDLLKCVGDQVAASLRNLQLAGKLLQVKEMEAFQTMSAFFVHDLKNTASTLGLMLKNLPIHFNDPAFREDALRGVSKTVSHINNLISRLSLLRHGLELKPVETDLNEVIARALAMDKGTLEVELTKEFGTIPKLLLDPEQFLKVVTNLLHNAVEAVQQPGQVRIQTSQVDGGAMLAVADNGCGMSPEFLNRSLFRPFKTTKKSGLGIGMFQSKMIIEAHGGRVDVESEAGKGTTFRVWLPLPTKNK